MKKASAVLIVIYLVFSAFSLACAGSKNISRDKAAKILKKMNYDCMEGYIPLELKTDVYLGPDDMYIQKAKDDLDQWIAENTPYLEKLKVNGYITYNETRGKLDRTGQPDAGMTDYLYVRSKFNIQPTDKLKPYIIGYDNSGTKIRVRLVNVVFSKITGISNPSTNVSVVEFLVKTVSTPLFNLVALTNNQLAFNRSAEFRLYDDGWRFAGIR